VIYKFKSKAAGDVIMMGPTGDEVLRAMGREPAAQGIVEPDAMPGAIAALEQAIAAIDAERARAEAEASAAGEKLPPRPGVGLRQRAWPFIQMLKRAHAAREPIVWGV
jgi:Domain of unknown function (DUF1840)